MTGDTQEELDIAIEEHDDEIILRLPRGNIIPTLLSLVKEQYRKSMKEKSEKPESIEQNDLAIQEAIDSWIEEIKEEKIAQERFAKIKARFDAQWKKW